MSTSIEENTHSFIVYTWTEDEPVHDPAVRTWRGHITHVASGEKFHFGDTRQVSNFLVMYLSALDTGEPAEDFRQRWRAFLHKGN